MAVLEGEALVLGDGAAVLSIVGGVLRIAVNGLDGVEIDVGGQRVLVEAERVRLDGGGRLELHADEVLRLDAGGTGVTFAPSSWSLYFPGNAAGWMKASPEHPDHGGSPYDLAATANHDDHLEHYYQRFPEERP
ncbi:MAG: hypothetical protein M9905_17500 [Rhizobiaceae bacterium]|nr:hypothetical protein [Rhizobiaceae bacterium]